MPEPAPNLPTEPKPLNDLLFPSALAAAAAVNPSLPPSPPRASGRLTTLPSPPAALSTGAVFLAGSLKTILGSLLQNSTAEGALINL